MEKIPQIPSEISLALQNAILLAIDSHQGLKGVDLVIKVMHIVEPTKFTHDEFIAQLNYCVDKGLIVEIAYTLPILRYRCKNIYFPKGTKIRVKKMDRN